MRTQFTLALRYLAGRKLRTVLTTLAITFGVLVLFGMNALLPTIMESFQANVKAAAGNVDATVTLKTSEPFDASVTDRVASVDGVSAVSGFLSRPVNLPVDYFDHDPDQTDAVTLINLIGLNISQAPVMHPYQVREGRFLENSDTDGAVISQTLADALDFQVGDVLTLPVAIGETRLNIVGILPMDPATGDAVYVTLAQAQSILALPDQINAVEANFNTVDSTQRTQVENRILNELGESFQLGSLTANSQFITTLGLSGVIFNLLGVLALLMGGFIIFNTFRTVIAERRRDIGMLRTLGANRGTILGIILAEGLLQGIIGTALGLVFGYLLAKLTLSAMGSLISQYINVHIGQPLISIELLVGTIAIGLGVTLIAGLLPAISASRVTPMQALRPTIGAISIRRMAGLGFWLGVVMLAVALALLLTKDASVLSLGGLLFIVGLFLVTPALVTPIANLFGKLLAVIYARGGTAQLAEGNLTRQPSRAAITASTTLIALAIVVMAAALVSSLQIGFTQIMEKSLGADYLILPPSVSTWGLNVGASQDLRAQLSAVKGVDILSSFRFSPALVDGNVAEFMGIDPKTFPNVSGLQFSAGNETDAYQQLDAGRAMIINGIFSSTQGVKIGDQVEVTTPSGAQTYQVVAVATDLLNAKIPTATISQANLETDFGVNQDLVFTINADPGADRDAVRNAIEDVLASYPQFRLIDGQAYIQENLALFQAAFSGLTAMLLFLAIPSLIAMVNTLAIGVIERTREIGMLRAIGATRGQVRTVILAEALILSGLGTAFGIATGMYLGYLAVNALSAAGFPTQFVFPTGGVLLAIAAGIVFGILAAIIPARQATKLQVVEALRYE